MNIGIKFESTTTTTLGPDHLFLYIFGTFSKLFTKKEILDIGDQSLNSIHLFNCLTSKILQ